MFEKNKNLQKLLEKIGFTESEARFYVVANSNPGLTIKDIQHHAKLSQASAYRAFESLREKGILTSSTQNWRKKVEVVSLKVISDMLKKEQRRLRKVDLELEELSNLNELSQNILADDSVEILVTEDKIIEKAYEILSRSWDRLLCYGSAERLIDVLGEKVEKDFIRNRCNKGRHVSSFLTEKGDFTKYLLPKSEVEYRDVKLKVNPLSQNHITYLYDDEVTIWKKDKSGKKGVVVKDPAIVESYYNIFDQLWNLA